MYLMTVDCPPPEGHPGIPIACIAALLRLPARAICVNNTAASYNITGIRAYIS